MMLCEEGLVIPQAPDGYPVGFPASLPPDGATRFSLGDDQVNDEMIAIYEDKYQAAVAVQDGYDRRYRMAQFNAQARYHRRLWVMDMKAAWDFEHQTTEVLDSCSTASLDDVQMQQHLEYAAYLDYMNEKMQLYDEDYRFRAITFKNDIGYQDIDWKFYHNDS